VIGEKKTCDTMLLWKYFWCFLIQNVIKNMEYHFDKNSEYLINALSSVFGWFVHIAVEVADIQ